LRYLDQDNSTGASHFQSAPSMNYKRRNFKLVVLNDNLYAVGGDNDCTVEIYDEFTDSWMMETAFPHQRFNFSLTANGNKITVYGGQDKRKSGLCSVDVYDVSTCEWNAVAAQPLNTVASSSSRRVPVVSSPKASSNKKSMAGGARRRGSSFCLNDNKNGPSYTYASMVKPSLDISESVLKSQLPPSVYPSGFVCGLTVVLPYSQLKW